MRTKIFSILMLACLFAVPNVVAEESAQYKFTMPYQQWAVELELPGHMIGDHQMSQDSRARVVFLPNYDSGLLITIAGEIVSGNWNANSCRQYYWHQAEEYDDFEKSDVRRYESEKGVFTEYFVKEYQGDTVNQKNIHLYLYENGRCVDIHMSKMDFETSERELFNNVILTVKLQKDYVHTSLDYMGYASFFYIYDDFRSAMIHYNRALNLEKKAQTLTEDYWRVLVDNLGMSHGLMGNFGEAEATFQYGIDNDPEYPFFYYNLACTYAETGNLDLALTNLQKALDYRDNKGAYDAPIPNPLTDSSFKDYYEDLRLIEMGQKINEAEGRNNSEDGESLEDFMKMIEDL